MGLYRVGHWLVLPALLLVRRLLPDLLPLLADLRLRLLVQPVHGSLRNRRQNLWTIRWGRLRCALQPEHGHLRARRVCLWTIRSAWGGTSLQPAHRHVRANATGLKRLWQLGIDSS